MIADIQALARIPAPTFAEQERLAWLERRLAGRPGIRARDDAGNLVWRWGEGAPELLLLAHVDTVFDAGVPLRIRREDGWLHGPGVGDNAAGVATTIHAVEALLAEARPRAGAVAFTVAEEGSGNLAGAIAACAALRPAAAIAVEGHGLDRVALDGVGSVRARVRIRGPGGHSWQDRGRPSAVHALLRLGAALVAQGTAEAPVNVGRIGGGTTVNAIAAEAEMIVERRAVTEAELDAFAATLDGLGADPGLSIAVELIGRRAAGQLDPDAPLAAAVRAVRTELGLPDATCAVSSDANAALAHGIPAVTIGCSRGADMHAPTERIEIASLALGRAQLEALLRRLLC